MQKVCVTSQILVEPILKQTLCYNSLKVNETNLIDCLFCIIDLGIWVGHGSRDG